MILLQLMKAFPGCEVSKRAAGSQEFIWYIGTLRGALQPGMTEWLKERDVRALGAANEAAYHLYWAKQQAGERRMIEAIIDHARTNIEDVLSGIREGVYERKNNPNIEGDVGKLARFEKVCKEAGLTS